MENVSNIFISGLNPVSDKNVRPGLSAGISGASDTFTDRVFLSSEARQASAQQHRESSSNGILSDTSMKNKSMKDNGGKEDISIAELRIVQGLRQRDSEVRAHELAHLVTAGPHAAGGPRFTYETGPDGKRYAVGGEVAIDLSKESTPEETLEKMRMVSSAALAPLNPSTADRSIAARAAVISAQAQREIQAEDAEGTDKTPAASPSLHMVLKAYRAQAL